MTSAPDSFRLDETTRAWVVVAPGRRAAHSRLPRDPGAGLPVLSGRCPFCPGNESDTEEAVAVVPAEGPWRVRVVHNRFPVVHPERPHARGAGGFVAVAATGRHEVVIESPDHDADLCEMPHEHVVDVLRVYRERLRALMAADGIRAVSVFRNRGRRAGSSQPHPHGQIIASPVVGSTERARDDAARAHHEDTGERLLASLLTRELDAGERVVEEHDALAVLCPFAPHFDYQTWIVPRACEGSFARARDELLEPLADALRRTLRALRDVTGGVDYNLIFRLPTVDATARPYAFWYVDLLPRRGGGAGFEMTSGIDIVTTPPEAAASALRAAFGH